MSKIKVALLGASGAVGRTMIRECERLLDSHIELQLMASERSAGQKISYRGQLLEIQTFETKKLSGFSYALMSAGGDFSRKYSEELVSMGLTVIDNSSAFRMDPKAQLIAMGANEEKLNDLRGPSLIANPNCSTLQLVVSLAPLQKSFGLDQLQVATYQSVSGAGQKGIDSLEDELKSSSFSKEKSHFDKAIAHSLIPAIDKIGEDFYSFEEVKMCQETRKILGLPNLVMQVNCVRVPTFSCHGESVFLKLKKSVGLSEVESAWSAHPLIRFSKGASYEDIPAQDIARGNHFVYLSRLRLAFEQKKSDLIQYWNISDNLYRGAASNAVEILQRILKHHVQV